MKPRSRKGIAIERRLPWLGRWLRGSGTTRLRACRSSQGRSGVENAACGKKIGLHSAQTARSCRLPTERRRSNSRGSLRIVSGLAENTHSIFCDGPPGPETANGCPVLRRQEPTAERHRARCELWQVRRARSSEARVRRTLFPLDKDLHGGRQTRDRDLRLSRRNDRCYLTLL